jgi:hypothetical protein
MTPRAPFAEPVLRRDERRGGGEAWCEAQGFGTTAATAPVPKSVLECGRAVSGAGPVRWNVTGEESGWC